MLTFLLAIARMEKCLIVIKSHNVKKTFLQSTNPKAYSSPFHFVLFLLSFLFFTQVVVRFG